MAHEHPTPENTTEEPAQQGGGVGRREFLKRSAVTGAVAWSAPTVLSMPGGAAWAQSYCCSAEAIGLQVRVTETGELINIDIPDGQECVVATGTNGIQVAGLNIEASLICERTDEPEGGPCTAEAEIADLRISDVNGENLLGGLGINPIHVEVLKSHGTAPCGPDCGSGVTGDSELLNLTLGNEVLQLDPNLTLDLGDILRLGIGREECNGNELTVTALDLNLLGLVEVVASRVKVSSRECACHADTSSDNLVFDTVDDLLDGLGLGGTINGLS